MSELNRPQLAFYAALAIAIGLLAARVLGQRAATPAAQSASAAQPASRPVVRVERAGPSAVVVHVAGAVRRPGVYRFQMGARVADAVRRAGGPRRGGDANQVNLAAKLADGQQVIVPLKVSAQPATAASAGAAIAPGGVAIAPIDLNSATAEQLEQLDGVGPATAQKILDWRRLHGGFRSVDDLGQVSGIGPKKLAAMRPHVRL